MHGAPAEVSERRARRGRLALVAVTVLVVALLSLWLSGALSLVTDAERLRQVVQDAGPAGPMVFVGLFTLFVPVGVPGLVFVIPAIVIWPAPAAFALCLTGAMTSSMVGIVASRYVARDLVVRRLPTRLATWDRRLADGGIVAVILLRLGLYLAAPADWLLGLSSISMPRIVAGTAIGMVPPTLMYTFAGRSVLNLFLDRPVLTIVGLVLLANVALRVRSRIISRSSASPPARTSRS